MTNHNNFVPSEEFYPTEKQPLIIADLALPEQQETLKIDVILPKQYLIIKKPNKKVAKEIPPPPPWLGRAVYWFRLSFAVVILISSMLSLSACGANAKEVQWQPASKYFEHSLLEQIVSENSSLTSSEEVINKLQAYQLAKQPPLTLVDFNNTELCGRLGCLYVIYLETQGKRSKVFSRYLRSELPKGVALIELSDHTLKDVPCIVVNQVIDSNLTKLTFCYNGSKYENFNSTTVKLK